jgi:membrane-associated phospholipid phosphatase
VAATTATFRVVGDMHYASDVITGAIVGSLVGYGVPLLHYARRDLGLRTGAVRLQLVPSAGGAGVVGTF